MKQQGMTSEQRAFVLGLLIGEGHFGGDGKQPHITLRMHTRHKPLLDQLALWIEGSKVYGPYSHGGRDYCQWMVRGPSLVAFLQEVLETEIDLASVDPHVHGRLQTMCTTYARQLGQSLRAQNR